MKRTFAKLKKAIAFVLNKGMLLPTGTSPIIR